MSTPAPYPFRQTRTSVSSVSSIPQVMHLMTVTPAMAEAWLKLNRNNRPINDLHVARLQRSMENGTFKINGDSIKFDIEGYLIDGQHKLTACVRSGIPLKIFVIQGLPLDVIPTIDRQRIRSAGDTLKMLHGVTDCNAVAATITMLLRLRDLDTFVSNSFRPTPQEVDEFYSANESLFEGVTNAITRCKYICQPSVVGAAYVLFRLQDQDKADRFFHQLATGEDLSKGDPVYLLRDRLIRRRAIRGRKTAEEVMILVLKTWSAFISGDKISMLSWNPDREKFETIFNRTGLITI